HLRGTVKAIFFAARHHSVSSTKESTMVDCTFELNGKQMSEFKCGAISFAAFSGLGEHINRRVSACIPNVGPIPPGAYYELIANLEAIRSTTRLIHWPRSMVCIVCNR
ncbi:MAG: hypothetical protein AAFZ92_11290, partial [Pseudomonadota bacterium]